MKLIYGTYNPSKLSSMKKVVEGLDIEILGLEEIGLENFDAPEDFKDPLENAISKAQAYYGILKQPLFSCDSGLYFEEVTAQDQPGVFIKRIHGQNLTYRGMLDYYSHLSDKYGGRLTAYYKNAICLIINEDEIYAYDGHDIDTEKFYLVSQPHEVYKEGFPLDSLSVEITSGKYYYDLKENQNNELGLIEGFRDFFMRAIYKGNDKLSCEDL